MITNVLTSAATTTIPSSALVRLKSLSALPCDCYIVDLVGVVNHRAQWRSDERGERRLTI